MIKAGRCSPTSSPSDGCTLEPSAGLDAAAVLAAMAVELSFSPWADEMILTLVGSADRLPEALGKHNVSRADDLDALLDRIEQRAAMQRDHHPHPILGGHRIDPDLADPWAPEIILINAELTRRAGASVDGRAGRRTPGDHGGGGRRNRARRRLDPARGSGFVADPGPAAARRPVSDPAASGSAGDGCGPRSGADQRQRADHARALVVERAPRRRTT